MQSTQIEDKNTSKDVRLVVELTIKNCASHEDFEDMGGVDALVKYLLDNESLFGIVDDGYRLIHTGIISDDDSGESCPGCFVPITLENVGGYRTFCSKCIEAFPEFPKDGGGYVIGGMFPKFKWVKA